jgi:hypothetical protein
VFRDLTQALARKKGEMRKWLGLAAVVCLIGLAVLAGVGEFSASGSDGSLPPPSFRPSAGWVSLTTGTSNTRDWEGVWAVTARSNLAALAPFDFPNNLLHLSRNAVYISAQTEGRGGSKREFPALEWPLRLSHFREDHGWEGQPAPNVQQRLRWGTVHGWHLDVRVYFATQHPSRHQLRAAQRELDRLLLPSG